MSKNQIVGLIIALAALVVLAFDSIIVINQHEQAIIRQFGEPKRVLQQPGLNFKLPLVQDMVVYDKRLLDMEPPSEQLILADQKRLVVDSYTRYRIENPLMFYQALGSENAAQARLKEIIVSSLRRVLGNVSLSSLLSEERTQIMADILNNVNSEAKRFGLLVADVRIRRADLPTETSQSIYDRMKSEREREAREARAQGQERAQQIRARADRERTVILAESQKTAQILRGEGDADANRIYAEAFNKDPEFFALYRSLQAYRSSLGDSSTTFMLSPDSEFFRYFNNKTGEKK